MSYVGRFEVKSGRFGAYFFDNTENKDMDLAEVVCTLNVLYEEHLSNIIRKNSESQSSNSSLSASAQDEPCLHSNGLAPTAVLDNHADRASATASNTSQDEICHCEFGPGWLEYKQGHSLLNMVYCPSCGGKLHP